jgi:hypothetical protein
MVEAIGDAPEPQALVIESALFKRERHGQKMVDG